MKKQNKGITLIALVITIIVLLILAGVSIVTLTGDNGLLTKSNQAVEENVKGEERDQISLAYQAVKLDELADNDSDDNITVDKLNAALGKNGITQATVTAEADGSLIVQMLSGNKYKVTQAGVITDVQTENIIPQPPTLPTTVSEAKEKATVFQENKKLTDDFGNSVTIPEGFKIASDSATDVTGGIVIEDATYKGTIGSQFVWIPVGTVKWKVNEVEKTTTITLGRYEFTQNSDGTVTTSEYKGDYKEEDVTSYNLEKYGNAISEDIKAFKASTGANKNCGYYIGRYEAGLDINSKLDTTGITGLLDDTAPSDNWTGWSKQDGTEAQIVCKQGQQVWNYITQNKASALSRNMYSNDLKFTTDLINSYAWDTAIVFIQTFGTELNSSAYSYQSGKSKDGADLLITGVSELKSTNVVDKQCNIFDMAGSTYEYTTETSNISIRPCVRRGGASFSELYPSCRSDKIINGAMYCISFRPILYF